MGLETVELVMSIEEKYGLDIKDEETEKLLTVQSLCDYILDHGFPEEEKDSKSGEVFDFVCQILIEQFHVPREDIKLESRFVDDLGLD